MRDSTGKSYQGISKEHKKQTKVCYLQDLVVKNLKWIRGFNGTSNVFLAKKYDIPVIGTIAHEFIMGVSGLVSLRKANHFALKITIL